MGRESELRLEKTPGTFSCFRPRGRSGDAKRRPNVTIIGRGPRKRENKKRPHGRAPIERDVRLDETRASGLHAATDYPLTALGDVDPLRQDVDLRYHAVHRTPDTKPRVADRRKRFTGVRREGGYDADSVHHAKQVRATTLHHKWGRQAWAGK